MVTQEDDDSQDGIEFAKDIEMIVRYIFSGLLIGLRGPVEVGEVELEGPSFLRDSLEHRDGGFDNLWSNTVGRDGSDRVDLFGFRGRSPAIAVRWNANR